MLASHQPLRRIVKLTNCYATLAEFKARFIPTGLTDTTDDAVIVAVIEAVSRKIEQWEYCNRWFYPRTATRYYTAEDADLLRVDDLLSVTTLKTDDDGDRTYETVWTTTDYDLEPFNALNESPPQPYTKISLAPNGNYSFPSTRRGVELVGKFGYYEQRKTSSATLAEDLDTSETGVDVSSSATVSAGMTWLIDNEQLHVQSISGNTATVTRAANGTTAATHTSGAAIQVYEYPIVNEAVLIQAMRTFKRKDAVFGVLASGDMQQVVRIARLDPDVASLVADLKKWTGSLRAV